MATKKKIAEHEIVTVESDRDRVRLRPAIYTTSTDKFGALHIMVHEIVDNALDELTAHDSVGDTVTFTFDTATKIFSVIDNGGGIPHDGMLNALSVLSSSGKYANNDDSHFGQAVGFNGYGAKLNTFLSDWSEVTSMRDGKLLAYRFEDGILKDTKTGKTKEHGTIVTGKLSQRFLDINAVTTDDIEKIYKEKSYLYPNIHMNLIFTKNGKQISSKQFYGKDIQDRVEKWKPDTQIIRVTDTRKVTILENIDDDKLTEKKVTLDVAFAFSEAALDAENDAYIIAYGNGASNENGGTHVAGLKEGIVKWFKQCVIPGLKGKDKELNIIPSDMTAGLCAFVTVRVYQPKFHAQVKNRLDNLEVRYAVRDAVFETLRDSKPSVINPMIEFIKRVTRGRLASKKTRKKDVGNVFSKDHLEKFIDIVYTMDTTCPTLILVEGDSASNCASTARDPHNQAIYTVKKPANVFDLDSESVNRVKTVFNDVLDICGIEAGKKCDPDKCTMKYILALTDGDIDGDSIAIAVICLLAKHCRPLVDAGMVGRILPPAYAIPGKNGKRTYVHTQREFFDLIMKKFVKEVSVKHNGKELSKKDLYDLLAQNFVYDTKLVKLANRYCCDPKFMEYIAWKYHGDETTQKKSYWMTALKKYEDIHIYLEHSMIIIDGDLKGYDHINLAFDEYFNKHVNRFKAHQSVNRDIYGYEINGEKDKSLYDVMQAMRKYIPNGVQRFKGLGELEPQELHDLCMDPEKRTVVIMKFKDYDKDMEKINVIMSTKQQYVEARNKLLRGMVMDDVDLDT